ncbi:PP2 domain-containing protein [Cephalotus follicularis]|uniref:PP2 domain-containing protein n=1 Tax=Cephalotus follicularis TaxID=3775 RepID=A0A1Q3B9A9_CEPFO|nr:PP2 domain-containing protein [Cephalotus follicularis]
MGAQWSQDQASQSKPSEDPRHNESQNMNTKANAVDNTEVKTCDAKAKVVENTEAAQLYDTKVKSVEKTAEVKLPHNYEAIIKDADSPIDKEKLYDQLCAGVFLNQNRKKYWVEKKFNKNCFMLFARDLLITWSENNRFWHWCSLKESSDVVVDVAELENVCWLEVHGKMETTKLSPETMYEVAFVIMMKDPAYGWEVPVNLRLTLPNGNKQEHKESLMIKPRGQWVEIPVGQFKTSSENVGEIEFSLYEYEGGKWKKGLAIKGVFIRPKN